MDTVQDVVGEALARLTANYLLAYKFGDDPLAERQMREEILEAWLNMVRELVRRGETGVQ